MKPKWPYSLFSRFGVELEYMIVDQQSLNILPVCDRILEQLAGEITEEIDLGDFSWCNELALHVIELKASEPTKTLQGWDTKAHQQIQQLQKTLDSLGARLMPTAAHPWMNPLQETRLWPHTYNPIYESYNRIFSCQGHGWSNLQSTHLNLPFLNPQEFGRLHAAIRLLMPIMPALTASSPILEGAACPALDQRLEVYRFNAKRIPSITGRVIPEPVFSPQEYEQELLQKLYRDIAPYDSEKILQQEWLNSRGAIARFDRGAIEIRILDIQETPHVDVAILALIIGVLEKLVHEDYLTYEAQQLWSVDALANIFEDVIIKVDQASILDSQYLQIFGFPGKVATARELWEFLAQQLDWESLEKRQWKKSLDTIFSQGCLSRRILKAVGGDWRHEHLHEVYGNLCECLIKGEIFIP
ncbi:MAG: glutamate--cysteine ligase [Candidatus Marinimicrobia bacterium]|nr:glutamate--cysteine ligase [Candidatus Neomarinimicrobiota bacterium]